MRRTLAATARQQYAAAQALPNLNFGTNYDKHNGFLQQASGNILNTNRDALFVGAGANAVAAGSVNIPGIQYNLNVGESLFRFYEQRQLAEAAAHSQFAVQNQVLLNVALTYTDLVRAQAMRAAIRLARDETQQVAKTTAAFAEAGEGRKADADRAATQLQMREAELIRADVHVALASARLVQLLNLNTATRLRVTDEWIVPRPAVPDLIPRRELLAIAVLQRPELLEHRPGRGRPDGVEQRQIAALLAADHVWP